MPHSLSTAILIVAATSTVMAEFSVDLTSYTDSFGDSLRVVDGYLSHIESGYWACYESVAFRRNYDRIAIEHSHGMQGEISILNFLLDSLHGIWFASCTTRGTGDWNEFTVDTFRVYGTYEGKHLVFVEFMGPGCGFPAGHFRDFTLFSSSDTAGSDTTVCKPITLRTNDEKSPPDARVIISHSASEAGTARSLQRGNASAVYDLRGRIEELVALQRQDAAQASGTRREGAGQVLVVVPGP